MPSSLPSLGSIALLAILVVVLISGGEEGGEGRQPERPREESPRRPLALVVDVIDGDTIEARIDGEVEDVRYIGIDTPESVKPDSPIECYGRKASRFNRRLVEDQWVRLDYDLERRDIYGRLLAYVYVGDRFVNAELVRRGYATTLTIPPNDTFADRFDRLQQRAGNRGRGLWGRCGP